jgi:regulator of extracellular matrix RemA (YlzA/DUF370 family)/uncharacterized protein YegP (UPF0339 family)
MIPKKAIKIDSEALRKKKESRFEFNNLGNKGKGAFMKVRTGLNNVYKEERADKDWLYMFKMDATGMGEDMFNRGMYRAKEDAIEGHDLLKSRGLPVAEFRRKVNIRGKERLKFEKARPLTEKELSERFPEIISIVQDAKKKGVWFDAHYDNFGINRDGKVVIMDTGLVNLKTKTPESMHDDLAESLQREHEILNMCKEERAARGELARRAMKLKSG